MAPRDAPRTPAAPSQNPAPPSAPQGCPVPRGWHARGWEVPPPRGCSALPSPIAAPWPSGRSCTAAASGGGCWRSCWRPSSSWGWSWGLRQPRGCWHRPWPGVGGRGARVHPRGSPGQPRADAGAAVHPQAERPARGRGGPGPVRGGHAGLCCCPCSAAGRHRPRHQGERGGDSGDSAGMGDLCHLPAGAGRLCCLRTRSPAGRAGPGQRRGRRCPGLRAVLGGQHEPRALAGPAVVTGVWDDHWVYWLGPVLGAVLAGLSYEFILAPGASREKLGACLACRDVALVETPSLSPSSVAHGPPAPPGEQGTA
ncbi:unnamed protein product [Coccothraustes coccothraustes]